MKLLRLFILINLNFICCFSQNQDSLSSLDYLYLRSKLFCDSVELEESPFCKSINFYRKELDDSCYTYSSKALLLSKNREQLDILNYIHGSSALYKGMYKKSLTNFLNISEQNKNYSSLKYRQLSVVYLNLKKYDESIKYINKWLNLDVPKSDNLIKIAFHNLGISYMHKKKFKKAKQYFDEEFKFLNLKDTTALVKAKIDLANVYYEQYLDDAAIPLFQEAYDLAKVYSNIELKQLTAQNMAVIERNRKRYKESVEYYQEYNKWKDSIWNRDRIIELADRDKKLTVAQKDKEIAVQEAEIKQKEAVQRGLLFGASGLLLFIAGLGFFYRKLKKQNAIISKQKEDLNVANKTKDYLFSVVSHDLRSPINTIKRQHLKLQKQLKNKEYDAVFETNNTAIALTESTSHLLNNVLHWSLDQNNQMSFNKDVYPLKPLIEQSVFDFEHIAEAKNIELTTNLDSSLLIKADKESLKIVLRNLLDNALKYTPEEGKIGVKTFLNNEKCIIEIQDTGQGISDEQLTKIKDLEDLTIDKINRSEGVGLGMLLCQTLIKKNHGKLIINSKIGQGTSIQVVLQTVKE